MSDQSFQVQISRDLGNIEGRLKSIEGVLEKVAEFDAQSFEALTISKELKERVGRHSVEFTNKMDVLIEVVNVLKDNIVKKDKEEQEKDVAIDKRLNYLETEKKLVKKVFGPLMNVISAVLGAYAGKHL